MNGNVIRTITIRGTSEGLDKLQADLTKLAAAHKDVAIAAEQTDKRTLSLEQAWKRQTLRLDEAARAQANIARETKLADAALREGVATQAQHAKQLELINQRYTTTATGAQAYGKALQQGTGEARLARHELINLSRQFQDVGVSLASGQAPMTVLVQQGSQIADVFASSTGTLKGFFSQAAAGAGRFIGSFAGMATSAASIGVGLAAAVGSFQSGQRDIEKGLSGMGRASGVTRDQINAIAEASSSAFGISKTEAQTAATAFAATGKIYAANVGQATKIIDDYARAGGDAAEVTKTLGAALMDPAKGAMELNKSLGFLNASTLENIRHLQAQGKEQEAQKALMDALGPAIQKQAQQTSIWAKGWNAVSNEISNFIELTGKLVAQDLEKLTGKDLGGFSTGEQLGRARERQTELRASPFQGAMAQPAIKAADLEVARLEAKKLKEELERAAAAFNKLSTEALAAADGFMPLQAQIRDTQQALAKLREYEAAGGYVDQAAIAAGQVRLQQLTEQAAAQARMNEMTLQLAQIYPGISLEIAKQLEQLNGQLQVAQARTSAEQLVAQEYVTQNNLLMQGKTLEEAMAVAAAQREIAEANVSRQIGDQIHALEQQIQLSQARIDGIEAAVKAEQAYVNALRQGASEAEARALEDATLRNDEQQESERNHNKRKQNYDEEAEAVSEVTDQVKKQTMQHYQLIDALEIEFSYYRNLSTAARVDARMRDLPIQFGDEQFVSSYDPLGLQRQAAAYEKAGTSTKMMTHGIPGTLGAFQYAAPDFDAISENLSSLVKSEDELTKSTDALNATMQSALSPFYSQDPRTTKLGFRAGVVGNPDWATGATNSNPLVAVVGAGATAPGMADGGSFTVGGGYSANDNRMAVFPVASGEQIVVNRNREGREGRGGQVINIDNRIIVQGNIDEDTLSKMKVSRFQQAQRMRAGIAQAS